MIDNISPEMLLNNEETFGPVVPVITVDGYEKAIELANATGYGLQMAIFTQDIDKAFTLPTACGAATWSSTTRRIIGKPTNRLVVEAARRALWPPWRPLYVRRHDASKNGSLAHQQPYSEALGDATHCSSSPATR